MSRPIPKTRMKVICHLIKDIRRHLLAMIIDEINLNRPRPKREPFNTGILVSAIRQDAPCQHPFIQSVYTQVFRKCSVDQRTRQGGRRRPNDATIHERRAEKSTAIEKVSEKQRTLFSIEADKQIEEGRIKELGSKRTEYAAPSPVEHFS